MPAAGHREPERAAVAGDRLAGEQLALDEPVDGGGHGGLGERETFGDERRPLGAGRDEGEHAVLGEGEVAGGLLERAGGEGEAPHGPGAAASAPVRSARVTP